MIYGADRIVQMPVMQLYDTGLMQQAINNARYMYDKAEKRMDDFYKEYDNFVTPIQKDQDWYNENVIGRFRRGIDELYANGEDPLRTATGRAKLAQLARSIDVGTVNKLRSSRDAANKYIEARGALEAAGRYNKDLEERFLGYDLSGWDTMSNGVWSRTAPTEMKTLKDLTEGWYNSRTARDLTKADLQAAGIPYDPRYQYSGYLDSDILNVARGNTPGWNDSVYSQYYRDLAKRQLNAMGVDNPTQQQVESVLQRNIADANQEWLINPTKRVDEFALEARRHANAVAMERLRYKHDMDVAGIKAAGKGTTGDPRYSATMNMVVDSEGALRGQLMTYANANAIKALDAEDNVLKNTIKEMTANPKKYSQAEINNIIAKANNQTNRRISVGLEGVANQVNGIANKTSGIFGGNYFTDTPEKLNTILRDLSSQASMTTATNILKQFGTVTSDGGVVLSAHRNRMTGIGQVMEDVLTRGYNDGKKHKSIDNAIKHLKSGSLSKYRPSWTAGSFDIRNEVDDAGWYTSGNKEFWPTGNVVSGDKYYYIEISNSPTDHDECCWFRLERDKVAGGGINPVISSLTQEVDDAFLKQYSNSNVIGNQQSTVQEFNK